MDFDKDVNYSHLSWIIAIPIQYQTKDYILEVDTESRTPKIRITT